MSALFIEAASAAERLAGVREWLGAEARAVVRETPGGVPQRLVVAPSFDAGVDIARRLALESDTGALLGLHCQTLERVAASLAEPGLARRDLASVGPLAGEAVAARALRALESSGGGSTAARWLERAEGSPGLPRVLWRTLDELRRASRAPAELEALPEALRDLARLYSRELESGGLADRAEVLWAAVAAAADPATAHPWLGLPVAFVDLSIRCEAEARLVEALAARSPDWCATAIPGDDGLARALGAASEPGGRGRASTALERLQQGLFQAAGAPDAVSSEPEEPADGEAPSVVFTSAPGEGRECVELVREMRRAAARGVPFDRMAVLLRSPGDYRGTLEEAFERAGIPFHSARGTTRPDPAGRAFLALLACAADGTSARAFSEYLSLAQLPTLHGDGTDSQPGSGAGSAADSWIAPDDELLAPALALEEREASAGAHRELEELEEEIFGSAAANGQDRTDTGAPSSRAGTLRTPRRFEALLVDAAVIGGRDRWERRLSGLAAQLEREASEAEAEGDERALRLREQRDELEGLQRFALPIIELLASLPGVASWGEWNERLGDLASRALRHPRRVQALLSELLPMASLDDVSLAEVRRVLTPRLRDVAVPPGPDRHGKVYVANCEAARGMDFDVVFVPGLAEKRFPAKITQDALLGDAARQRLGLEKQGVPTRAERVAEERLLLRIAVGAARESLVLSYPRVDVERNRPRVPSFYALEAARASTGRLPGFDEFARRAEGRARARLGWPAPLRLSDAIDEAEHDLVLLQTLLREEAEASVGKARFLLEANPFLGRALRFRARRWLRGWSVADGLVKIDQGSRSAVAPSAREAIAEHALSARSYSATALQNFAHCPYRFFLYAVLRLSPREVPEAIDELTPLQRGSLVHDVQFELFQALDREGKLPVRPANLAEAQDELERVIESVAERYRDELAPAIERVWDDGVAAIRGDLREWLRRMSERDDAFVPAHFELAFGVGQGSLASREHRDPESRSEPVALDAGISLRGSIDLVERAEGAPVRIRVVDHKTGRERFGTKALIDGGRTLQPVLYALAAEKLFPGAVVEEGTLSYCTSAGGFRERGVALDDRARASAERVAKTLGEALEAPFLPAAPAEGACRFCDFRAICGPYEEQRSARKNDPRDPAQPWVDALRELRRQP